MKNKLTVFTLFVVMLFSFTLSGWTGSNNSNTITSFYYYKNSKFNLTFKNDRIFVKLANDLSQGEFISLVNDIPGINGVEFFNEGDNRFFVTLGQNLNEASVIDAVDKLKAKKEVMYASPVFSPDNGKTLIGVENEILVQFKSTLNNDLINDFITNNGFEIVKSLDLSGGASYVLRVPENTFAIDAANFVYNSSMVNWSEPNLYFTNLLCYTPNDPFYPQQWSLRNIGTNVPGSTGIMDCDMDVDSAWDVTLGSNAVKVAVSDTGCDTTHADMAANFILGSGYDFYNNDPYAWDDQGHGTRCAGEIAALANNNLGVAGIATNSRLIPIKWLSSSGNGNYAGAVSATNWGRTQGAYIISNSWGFVGGSSSALDAAINDAANLGRNGKGTLFVVASGNENGNNMRYPASTHPKVLTVGGISPCNQRKSSTSCDGESFWGASYGNNLHVVAPCVKVYTTSIGSNYVNNFNGTSSATPNTAGVTALMFAIDTNQTWDSVRARITRTAEKRGTYTYTGPGPLNTGGWNLEMGYGLVNAYLAVRESQSYAGPTIQHTPLPNTENVIGPYTVNCVIVPAQAPIIPALTKLHWSRNNTTITDSIALTNTSGNNWTAAIPGNGSPATYRYYLRTFDTQGKKGTSPGGAPAVLHLFNAGPDNVKPIITHTPILDVPKNQWPATITATVVDPADFGGLDSVWVRWYRNNTGTGIKHVKLISQGNNVYSALFNSDTSQVNFNDSIKYRIFAQDNSSMHNRDSSALYTFKIVSIVTQCYGTGTTSIGYPFYTFYMDSKTDMLYLQNEVGVSGNITQIGFDVLSAASQAMNGFQIKMQHTTQTSLTGFTTTGWTTVYSGTYTVPATGLQYITLQNPFFYNNTQNLLVQICFNNSSYTSNTTIKSTTAASQVWHRHADLSSGDGCVDNMTGTATTTTKPNICFKINTIVGLPAVNVELPKEYRLSQNYPNPFNPSTVISYSIPKAGNVTLTIFDITGKEVARLINGEYRQAGTFNVSFDASHLASGMYLYRIESGSFIETKKMVLIK